jgi:hypothetical protein
MQDKNLDMVECVFDEATRLGIAGSLALLTYAPPLACTTGSQTS